MQTNWLEVLGWGASELEDLKFVGYSYLKEGQYEIAQKFFEALYVLDKDDVYVLQTLGALYLQLGKNNLALELFEKALTIDPQHAATLLNKTKALFFLGRKGEATHNAQALLRHHDLQIANQAEALLLAFK